MKYILTFVFLCLLVVSPYLVKAGGLSNTTVIVPPNLVDTTNNNLAFGGTLSALTTGSQNICLGLSTCAGLTTGFNNIVINNGESMLSSGSYNILIGYLTEVVSGGTSNSVGIGGLNVVGSNDVAIGANALSSTTTDTNTATAVGKGALQSLTTGAGNTALGYLAANTAIGGSTQNTVIGARSCPGNQIMSNNTCLGYNSGHNLANGNANTIIGYNVGTTTIFGGSNNILIGVSAAIDATTSQASNEIHIGGTGGDWWKVTGANTQSTQAGTIFGTVAISNIASDATHTDASICEDTTTHILYAGSGTLGICLGTSSIRFKKNIIRMNDGLAQISLLKPVNFHYKFGHGDDGAKQQYGFLAEDVVNVLPTLVGFDKDGQPNSVDMLGMVPILVHAVQEQQTEIEQLKARRK